MFGAWVPRNPPLSTMLLPTPVGLLAPLSALRVPPQQVQEISSVEASLRLDAIASAGEATRRG